MKMINALLITMKIVMKLVIKEHITLNDMYSFNDAIADVETQIKRLEDATNGSKANAEIEQSEAEMMVEHKDGTVEYIKDIDNIMLLADKNYQIGYTGRF